MADDKVKRRLTTVLCADVYGYSRLMEADETGTLETLRRYRAAIARLVERHDGRIVNTWGDAVIAEFASVVEAVQCAVEIQQEISSQASDAPQASPMQFRIGINLGDVMVDGSDIYGDGVNIAARLQELAEPGGVVISSSVYDQVHNKLSVGFDCLGQRPMKNIAPLTSYRLTLGGRAAQQSFPTEASAAPSERARAARMENRGMPTSATNVVSTWLARLPRPVAAALTVSALLIAINLLTSRTIWFHWPVAAILFGMVMRMVLGNRPESDSRTER
ncbi:MULTISPECIES: adenylate/guanylate cyclase domain-containing protein [unclassified Bradyrhizobium]|uniref:adenylate/guanylate cyclase domain-containing protein n=1 Tax=unclassified Bradyrhizobium TaxID=2631580 RepID=UPI00211DD043|nr:MULTISPECIES: adenylate/guanylate cyclase domain-containing protein [unclassified Bradyrhizobium]MDD1537384.1 guanylate cyclase [Bradyrhizobium sp. WBOS8]MDD1586911.1 guanylate cyclase [Bradyrhizobium sp. WBOS4]UUO51166.1 guanylate cyclase [Bradyrhizobium sp. WBOS04]UUO63524.1 guanylate cyclase [Bradyrhizobium sp. WBOS08]